MLLPRLHCPIGISCPCVPDNCLLGRHKRCKLRIGTQYESRYWGFGDGRWNSTYFCLVSFLRKAFSQHPAHSTHISAFSPPSSVSRRINTHSLMCKNTPCTQLHVDGHFVLSVVFLRCTNNCNCVFKRQVAQRTKNSTVSCGAEMLSLRRGGGGG